MRTRQEIVDMVDDQVATVRARVRARTPHDVAPAEERWEQARGTYQDARAEILGRVAEGEFVVAWYVDRD
ncbi:hypothetical protein [Microlunatus sp. Gsoil 973]|uniref:hypothetical protein n=1 Tax=Microlunatus sp. Gsoil 973 TaxID=2672569 RepID=UPI001E3FCFDF|nr:hypothetical protein [Microlunatus sp. Gsoil 973]